MQSPEAEGGTMILEEEKNAKDSKLALQQTGS